MADKQDTEETYGRQEHLDWCKQRALEYVDRNDLTNAFASMASDISKHEETNGHIGIGLGTRLLMAGHLSTEHKMREWIVGFN